MRPTITPAWWNPPVAAVAYADEVLADTPSLYWRLGEPSGTTANDETANNRDGTYGAGVTLAAAGLLAGDADTSVDFTGANATSVVTSSYNPFSNAGGQTFEFWLYRDVDNDQTNIFGSSDAAAGPAFVIDNAGRAPFFFSRVSAGAVQWAADDIPKLTVCHVVLTFDPTTNTAELWVNGVSKGTKTQANDYDATPGDFQIGTWGTSALSWDGRLDEVAVYESILSSTRIAAHYAAGT